MLVRALLTALFMAMPMAWVSCTAGNPNTLPVKPGALVALSSTLGTWSATAGNEQTIVLVALDGVRWREVFHGVEPERALAQGMQDIEILDAEQLVPNLQALSRAGTALSGSTRPGISASGPNFISVPGYMELLTGNRHSGCTTNHCRSVSVPTIADEFAAQPDVSPRQVAVIASWEGIGRAASSNPSALTVSVGRTSGKTRDRLRYDRVARALLEAGEQAGPAPGGGDFRRDRETAAIALHYLRTQRPRFLFVGLGETDEYAHKNDYRGYLRALSHADYVIGQIAAILSAYERQGRRATLIVTTDHGRSDDFVGHGATTPESAEIWMVAAGWGIRPQGVVMPREPRYLANISATIRAIGGLEENQPSNAPLAEALYPSAAQVARAE